MKLNENIKVTLTISQLKKLIRESTGGDGEKHKYVFKILDYGEPADEHGHRDDRGGYYTKEVFCTDKEAKDFVRRLSYRDEVKRAFRDGKRVRRLERAERDWWNELDYEDYVTVAEFAEYYDLDEDKLVDELRKKHAAGETLIRRPWPGDEDEFDLKLSAEMDAGISGKNHFEVGNLRKWAKEIFGEDALSDD